MAIRDVVTMGFGNGTFSPGVVKLPTIGYSIGPSLATPIHSGCWAKGELYKLGYKAGELYNLGFKEGQKVC